MVHRADCAHIRHVRNGGDPGGFTNGPGIKVCADSVNELLQYIGNTRTARLTLVRRCRSCDAIRSDIRMEPTAQEAPVRLKHDLHSTTIAVNIYEWDPQAVAICLAHHGAVCRVCAVDLRRRYGVIGEGYMHVHHLRNLTDRDVAYVLDPINDLVPVCPNCHAMLHRGREKPRSVEELRRVMEMVRMRDHGPNGWVERMERAGQG
jgi:5-methylcytosine-specific restriction protein A